MLFVVSTLFEVAYNGVALTDLEKVLSDVLLETLHVHQVDVNQKFEGLVLAQNLSICAFSLEEFIVFVDVSTEQDGSLCCHCVLWIVLDEDFHNAVSQVIEKTHSVFCMVLVTQKDHDERFEEFDNLHAC